MSDEDNNDDEELSPRERMKKMMEGEGDDEEGRNPMQEMMGGLGGGGGMGPMGGMMGMGGMGPSPGGSRGGSQKLEKEVEELRVEAVKIRETLERIASALED